MKPIYLRLMAALFLTMAFAIFPLPTWLASFRPPLSFLLVLYIQFFVPDAFKLTLVFIIGLSLDVLMATVIGQHAFAMLMVNWIINSKARRIHFFSLPQQALLVGGLSLIYTGFLVIINILFGYAYNWYSLAFAPAVSMMVWPWFKLLLDDSLNSYISRGN